MDGPDVIIDIFGEISEDTFKDVLNKTKALPDGSKVELRISSYGGEILRSFAIIDSLKRFYTHGNIIGFACSAAAIIAISCTECSMSENASILLHSAWAVSVNGEDPGIKHCNDLQVEIIHKRCPEFSTKFLDEDVWLTAKECLALHLADNIYIDVPFDVMATCKRYAAKLSHLTNIKGESQMDEEKIEEIVEEIKENELAVDESADQVEEEKAEEENHDILEVIEKLSEEINSLKARMVALEEMREEKVEEEEKVEAECGEDHEQERINNIYKNIVAPQAKVAIGTPKAAAMKPVQKVDYKAYKKFILDE